jgi:hypothetical protein
MLDKGIEICYRLQGLGDFDTDCLLTALYDKAYLLEDQGNFEGATEVHSKVLMIRKETLVKCTPQQQMSMKTLQKHMSDET